MTELNIPLARKVMDHITANPREWEQGTWYAEGPYLTEVIVGRIREERWERTRQCLDAEEVSRIYDEAQASVSECGTAACFAGWSVLLSGYNITSSQEVIVNGEPVDVADLAEELLGLDAGQSSRLFYGGNTIDDLWCFLERFSGGEIRRPEPT